MSTGRIWPPARCSVNTAVVDQQLPRRFEIAAPPTNEEEVIRRLVDAKCSTTAMWVKCGAVAFNSASPSLSTQGGLRDAPSGPRQEVQRDDGQVGDFCK